MPPRRRKSDHGPGLVQDYIDGSTATDYRSDGTAQSSNRSIKQQVTHAAKGMFLPEGYPDSVAPDYLPFQTWDTLQGLCSYIRGLLTAQAVLKGVGVGQQAATPLAAVFLFFLRDLAGMLGGILFAFWQGSSFDTCAKQWRLFADVTNDVGMAAELASPFFPGAFLAMACFGSVARAVTGVAGGATRAALTMHFALRGNAADVSAKESSQETATTLFGMVLGMAFTKVTADHAASAWTLFVLLTVVHIWANVRALRCLVLSTVNIPRLELLVKHHLQHGHVPGPTEMASLESLVPPPLRPVLLWLQPWTWRHPRLMPIQFGVTLSEAAHEMLCGTKELCDTIVHAGTLGQEHVLLCSRRRILVALHKDFTAPADLLRAYIHAQVLASATQDRHTRAALAPVKRSRSQSALQRQRSWSVGPAPAPGEDPLTWSHEWMTHHCATFLHKCESQGWDLGNTQLKAPRYLISYPIEHPQQQQEVAAATKRFREGKHVVIPVS